MLIYLNFLIYFIEFILIEIEIENAVLSGKWRKAAPFHFSNILDSPLEMNSDPVCQPLV